MATSSVLDEIKKASQAVLDTACVNIPVSCSTSVNAGSLSLDACDGGAFITSLIRTSLCDNLNWFPNIAFYDCATYSCAVGTFGTGNVCLTDDDDEVVACGKLCGVCYCKTSWDETKYNIGGTWYNGSNYNQLQGSNTSIVACCNTSLCGATFDKNCYVVDLRKAGVNEDSPHNVISLLTSAISSYVPNFVHEGVISTVKGINTTTCATCICLGNTNQCPPQNSIVVVDIGLSVMNACTSAICFNPILIKTCNLRLDRCCALVETSSYCNIVCGNTNKNFRFHCVYRTYKDFVGSYNVPQIWICGLNDSGCTGSPIFKQCGCTNGSCGNIQINIQTICTKCCNANT